MKFQVFGVGEVAESESRYGRQTMLPEVGGDGQDRLARSRVLVIGAGGVGCAAAAYLACAGIGRLAVADFDRVEASNLQRQILYCPQDAGKLKAECAAGRLAVMNPDIAVVPVVRRVDEKAAEGLFADYDFIIAATDSLSSKRGINRACVRAGLPFAIGGAAEFSGQVLVHVPKSACYNCFFPEDPEPDPAEAGETGILGAVAGVAGTMLATAAINCLLGLGRARRGGCLLGFDGLNLRFRTFEREPDPDCCVCGRRT